MTNIWIDAIATVMYIILVGPVLYYYLKILNGPFIKPLKSTTTLTITTGPIEFKPGQVIKVTSGGPGLFSGCEVIVTDQIDNNTIVIMPNEEAARNYSKDHLEPDIEYIDEIAPWPPPKENISFADFTDLHLKAISTGLKVPYHMLAGLPGKRIRIKHVSGKPTYITIIDGGKK